MIDASLLAKGQALATVDGVTYQAVKLVFACDPDSAPTLYCSLDDWPSSHVARLATKDHEIAELARLNEAQAAKVLELTQRLNALEEQNNNQSLTLRDLSTRLAAKDAPPETPAQNQAAQFRAQAAYLKVVPPDPIVCPDCGKDDLKNARALQMHRQRAHQGMVAVRVPNEPLQFVEELGWRCAAKGCSGAHARSLSEPNFCTLHAAPHTNGHLSAADLEVQDV